MIVVKFYFSDVGVEMVFSEFGCSVCVWLGKLYSLIIFIHLFCPFVALILILDAFSPAKVYKICLYIEEKALLYRKYYRRARASFISYLHIFIEP